MSGPIIGRRLGRRQNNSEIGTTESIHAAGDPAQKRANTYDNSYARNYGIRTMNQVTKGVFNSTFRDVASGGGTSTTNHQVFSNTVNPNNEVYGGGSVGESLGAEANALRIYGDNRFNQSKYPYYTPFFTTNEISTLQQSGGQAKTSGYGGANNQGYRDSTSRAAQWKFRQVINVAYTGGGYKDGSPWRQIHRTNASTDQTTNLGIQMDHPGSYVSGACSDTTFFLWSTPSDNSHFTPSSRTSGFHMYSETGKSHNSNFNTYSDRNDSGTSFKETFLSFHGGGDRSGMEVFNLATEARQSNNGGDLRSGTTNSAFSDKDKGYHWADSAGWTVNHQTFSVSGSSHWSAHGQQKGIPSKIRIGYCGNEGSYNGGYNLRRWNLTNDSNTGTFSKYRSNCGEENFTLGQDWQYMIGNYDGGGQNNGSWKQYYHTDSNTDVSGLQPTANGGQSSGHCGWRT